MNCRFACFGLDFSARHLSGKAVNKCCIVMQRHDVLMVVPCAAVGRESA